MTESLQVQGFKETSPWVGVSFITKKSGREVVKETLTKTTFIKALDIILEFQKKWIFIIFALLF